MKILHTADWHLGKSFNNYNLLEEQRSVLQHLLEIVRREKPDMMLLAGDIYDRSVPPAEAVRLFDEIMSEIILECKVPVIAIAGNHDNPERINYCNYLLKRQGLHIFGSIQIPLQPIVMEDAFGEIYFYPIPYTEPEVLRYYTRDDKIRSHEQVMQWVVQHIQEKHPAGKRKVLIGHAFIGGGTESESERQLLVGGAAHISPSLFTDFDYVALGHLHQPQVFLEGKMRYSGSLLKYSFSEAHHQKSVCLLEMDGEGKVQTRLLPLIPPKDVRRIKGKIENRIFQLSQEEADLQTEDLLEVTLENEEIVPNAMQIVQKQYPNAMTLKWPQLQRVVNQSRLTSEHLHKMTERDLFSDFYKRFRGKDLSKEKQVIIEQAIQQLKEEDK